MKNTLGKFSLEFWKRAFLLLCILGCTNHGFTQDSLLCKESYSVTSVQFICRNCSGERVSVKFFSCEKQDSIITTDIVQMDATPQRIISITTNEVTKVQLVEPFKASILIPNGFDYHYFWMNEEKIYSEEHTNEPRMHVH